MDKEEFVAKIILDEISGKNLAIHAYDKIIWTVRTGFLTLFFAGWGILLKSNVDTSSGSQVNLNQYLIAMLLISVALSFGGLIIDQSYIRRKFRVIYALDSLLLTLLSNGFQIVNGHDQINNYIQVSGDKDDSNYLKVSGYSPAWKAGLSLYLVPVILSAIAVMILWK